VGLEEGSGVGEVEGKTVGNRVVGYTTGGSVGAGVGSEGAGEGELVLRKQRFAVASHMHTLPPA
jgi:hypothetical protein